MSSTVTIELATVSPVEIERTAAAHENKSPRISTSSNARHATEPSTSAHHEHENVVSETARDDAYPAGLGFWLIMLTIGAVFTLSSLDSM